MKQYIYNIYNFLNNTKGEIYDYELKFICESLEIDYEKTTIEQFKKLNELIETGDREEEFYDYLISMKEV